MTLVNWLKGKKTYFVAALNFVYALVVGLHDHNWALAWPLIFGSGGGASLRAAIAKIEAVLPSK